jgi:hypothetical protein
MIKQALRALVATAGIASAAMAQADTVTFNFINSGSPSGGFQSGPITFTGSDGISTLTAHATSTGAPGKTSYLDSSSYGLLVCTGTSTPTGSCGWGYGDEHYVDSAGFDELIMLDFGAMDVTLLSATFYSNWAGRFDLGVDGSLARDEKALANSVSFGAGHLGSAFSFSADSTESCATVKGKKKCTTTEDYFKLTSITVEIPKREEIPLPGTLGLLSFGLAGLATMRKRKPVL